MTDRLVSEQTTAPQREMPIKETAESISYLGVRLPKARESSGPFVPKREQYTDFIEEKFSLNLQKDIAISMLQGDPLLIEGGTSIGKTTTVRKMAAELGWEVHYANLNGATDVEDLMGRYIPNANKKKPEDPEYVFVDGKVTSGLRKEEGKLKVIILDEFNSAAPNILIRLHEVLDSLQRGENIVLSEDASEGIPVDKNTTKVIALMNPPGKGYFGREPLDPAQLRRWVYLKAPSDLPEETFSYSTDALFSLVPQQQEVSDTKTLPSRDSVLLPEQIGEIPGISKILAKYKEFHKAAKQLIKERKVAADQPQPFMYDDRMEPKRVRDFVLTFYNGDINETFKTALKYYYVNKLDSDLDRQKVEELIKYVEYVDEQKTSQRKGVSRETIKTKETEVVGRDPKEFLDEFFKSIKGSDLKMPQDWSWYKTDKIVDFHCRTDNFQPKFIDIESPSEEDEKMISKCYNERDKTKEGIDQLIKEIGDRKFLTVSSKDHIFLKILDRETDLSKELVKKEKEAWKKVLGTEIEVPPLPDSITTEVKEKLKELGMELRFIPEINLGDIEEIKTKGIEGYLNDLESRYPNWRRFEKLTGSQTKDHSVGRNLRRWYWKEVTEKSTPFPELPGRWIAVETMPKPMVGDSYEPLKITDIFGLKNRFDVSWDKVVETINNNKKDILSAAELSAGEVRMLEAIEWNLLANREGWGKTNTYELTNTKINSNYRLGAGDYDTGGAAKIGQLGSEESAHFLGFRLAIVL